MSPGKTRSQTIQDEFYSKNDSLEPFMDEKESAQQNYCASNEPLDKKSMDNSLMLIDNNDQGDDQLTIEVDLLKEDTLREYQISKKNALVEHNRGGPFVSDAQKLIRNLKHSG